MIRLFFIVPYPELEEKVRRVLSLHPEKDNLDAVVTSMTVEDIPDVPVGDYDAVIARGYTAQLSADSHHPALYFRLRPGPGRVRVLRDLSPEKNRRVRLRPADV